MQQEVFENLLAEQKVRKDNFYTFRTSYHNEKDAKMDNVKFFERQLEKLQMWWLEFDKTNTELMTVALEEKDQEIGYFKNNEFDMLKKEYQEVQEKIQNDIVEARDKVKTDLTSATSSRNGLPATPLRKVLKSRPSNIGIVNVLDDEFHSPDDFNAMGGMMNSEPPEVRVMQFQLNEVKSLLAAINGEQEEASIGMASAQLDNIKTVWNEIRATYREILMSENNRYCERVNLNDLQIKYVATCGKLIEITKNKNENMNANLPKLKLPEFDGTTSWRTFRELFDEIVHFNKSLTERAKVQYLKTVLKGEAAAIVSCLGAHEANYQAIYEALIRRYDNRRQLVSGLIDKLLNIPKQINESSAALRKMHDVANECMTAIKNLKVNTENWDPIIVHILMKKLNKTTILEYESKLANVRELQTLPEFLNYIENRFMALSSTESAEKSIEKINENYHEKQLKKKCHSSAWSVKNPIQFISVSNF